MMFFYKMPNKRNPLIIKIHMIFKPVKLVNGQIEKLKYRGYIIKDENYIGDILNSMNYYQLSAYFLSLIHTIPSIGILTTSSI